ncbi:MAG TPA: hypothetical protein VLQ90_11520 [Pyrinomonadaceae bacterium]|nr:hypothetical protein [Pyrinomonadaceae bacterium]
MRRTFAILLILLVSAVVAAAQAGGEWIKYTSAEGRYSVSLPQPPTLSTKISTASSGENLLQYRAISMDGNGGFLVAYYDYERDMTFSLKKARDSIVANLHATVLEESQISLGGSAGKQLKFLAKVDPGGEFVDRARMYDVRRRIYILQCILPKAADGPEGIYGCEKFFDSFKVQSGP